METSSIDMISLLSQRASLVQQIADGGASKRTLTMELPLSRSTVTRAIQDLTTAHLIQKDNNKYKFTLPGKIAYREFRCLYDRCDCLIDVAPMLDHLPKTAALPSVVLDNPTIIRPTLPTPDLPQTRFANRIRQSEVVVGTDIVVNQRLVEVFHEQLTEYNIKLSLVFNKQVIDYLRNTNHDILHSAVKNDNCILRLGKQLPPFSLTIIDSTDLWISIYSERGQLQGILKTESTEAIAWAEGRIQQYIEQASSVSRYRTAKG